MLQAKCEVSMDLSLSHWSALHFTSWAGVWLLGWHRPWSAFWHLRPLSQKVRMVEGRDGGKSGQFPILFRGMGIPAVTRLGRIRTSRDHAMSDPERSDLPHTHYHIAPAPTSKHQQDARPLLAWPVCLPTPISHHTPLAHSTPPTPAS